MVCPLEVMCKYLFSRQHQSLHFFRLSSSFSSSLWKSTTFYYEIDHDKRENHLTEKSKTQIVFGNSYIRMNGLRIFETLERVQIKTNGEGLLNEISIISPPTELEIKRRLK